MRPILVREALVRAPHPTVDEVRVVSVTSHHSLKGLERSFDLRRIAVKGFQHGRIHPAVIATLRFDEHRDVPILGVLKAHQLDHLPREHARHPLGDGHFATFDVHLDVQQPPPFEHALAHEIVQ